MPAADVAVKLAKALNVTTEYLVIGDDGKSEDRKAVVLYHKYEKIITLLEKLDGTDMDYVEAMIMGIVARSQDSKTTFAGDDYAKGLTHKTRFTDM